VAAKTPPREDKRLETEDDPEEECVLTQKAGETTAGALLLAAATRADRAAKGLLIPVADDEAPKTEREVLLHATAGLTTLTAAGGMMGLS
jgi:hypothetical protein